MDHDRDKGEGVGNQKYTAIKIKVLEPFPACLQPLAGKQVFCLAGTLRPETMCGQTNAWILPEGDYAAFDAGGDVAYVCAPLLVLGYVGCPALLGGAVAVAALCRWRCPELLREYCDMEDYGNDPFVDPLRGRANCVALRPRALNI